ncbi:FHA domain-containing protein [Mariniblastus sp.]|jgi:hypothetical protein|nr:FHA domain-containing protein [Mariniblastus sp.]MDB4622984.1 FHA domain-containing protein [bacterium]
MLEAKLVVVGGDAKKAEVSLDLPVVIGRGKEAGLTVPHALVSRKHTEIYEQSGRLFVRDLGSLNGTYLNNTRIECDQPLDPDQLLTLGNITFRAVYELGPAAISPAADETLADFVSQSETAAIPVVEEVIFNEPAKVGLPVTSTEDSPHVVEPIPLASAHQLGSGSLSKLPLAASLPVAEVAEPAEIVASQPTDPVLFEEPSGTNVPSDTADSFVGRETLTDSSVFQFSSDDQNEPSRSAEFSESPPEEQPEREDGASLDDFLKNFPK